MSDSKKPKLSEIRARDQSAPGGARFDVPYLLDLVERMGGVIEQLEMDLPGDPEYADLSKKARELLKEISL